MTFTLTARHLASIAGCTRPLMTDLANWMNQLCPQYDIDTPQEFCHFLAQACHETDHFVTLREYASGRAYEGRVDLGNTQLGDGVRFKGRGIFQTTGRANYMQLGIKKGRQDLFLNHPELLEQPEYAVWSACEYWRTRGLNDVANHADTDILKKKYRGNIINVTPVEYISLAINGGYNGLEERKKYYAIAQRELDTGAAATTPAPRGAPTTIALPGAAPSAKPAAPRRRRKLIASQATGRPPARQRVVEAAPGEAMTIHSGTISAINNHLQTVVMAKGKPQTLQTSSLRGLRPGVLIA